MGLSAALALLVGLLVRTACAGTDPRAAERDRAPLLQSAEAQVGRLGTPTGEAALADTLWQLDADEAAVRLYARIAAPLAGSPASRTALGRILSHAVRTGDFGDVDALLPRLPDEMWPADALPRVAYRRGVLALEAGDLEEAKRRLGSVPAGDDSYTAARLLLGVAHVRSAHPDAFEQPGAGELEAGVGAFVDVVRNRGKADSMEELRHLDRVRDLAIVDIARVYHAIGRHDDQLVWADNVPRASPLWRRAQVEAAWAELATHRPVTQRLAALGPHLDQPEVDLILGLDAMQRCDLDSADRAGRRLTEVLSSWRAVVQDPALRGTGVDARVLDVVLARMAADRELAGIRARIEEAEAQERELAARSDPASALTAWLTAAYRAARADLALRAAGRSDLLLARERAVLDRLDADADKLLEGVEARRRLGACPPG